MKKQLLSAILATTVMLSLGGCGKPDPQLPPISTGNAGELATDFQKNMNQSTSSQIRAMCETESGYYFEYDCKAYYLDKTTAATTILCAKPECTHSTNECNAFVDSPFLAYYNGKLYSSRNDYVEEEGGVTNKGERLHSRGLDGGNHDVIQNLDFTPGGDTNNYITAPMIHRGVIYFAYSGKLYAVTLGDKIENAVSIYGEEQFSDGSNIINPNELYYELWADDDIVYFMAKNVRQSDGTYKDTLFSYDPKNKNTSKLWKVPGKSEVGTWDTTGVSVSRWYVNDGYIYFYLSGNDIWKTELATGKTSKVVDLELSAGAASFSDDVICVINQSVYGTNMMGGGAALTGGDTLYVYGYGGTLLNEISLKQIYKDCANVSICEILWIDDGEVYIHADATEVGVNGAMTTQRHHMYRVNIESGSLTKIDWVIGK